MVRRAFVVFLIAGWIPSAVGCVATPLPDPPDLDPPNTQLVSADAVSGIVAGFVELEGAAGAAAPGATLRVYALDTTVGPVDTTIAEDGSFDLRIESSSGDELRLTLFTDSARSIPLDVVVPASLGSPLPAPRTPCVVVAPELEVAASIGVAAAAPLTIRNDCGSTITASAQLRVPAAGVSLDPAGAIDIAPGATGTLTVRYDSAAAAQIEEIVLVNVTGSIDERRPVTVRARAD